MSLTEKGFDERFMISGFAKEATYNAGVDMSNDANAFSLGVFSSIGVTWDDTVTNDKEEDTGSQFGTDQELTEQNVTLTINESKAKPNTVAAFAALVLGAHTHTKDGADDAYTHYNSPVALGTDLKSVQAEHKKGRIQYKYQGLKGNSLKLAAEAGGFLSLESELFGSGTRSPSATAFATAITESWLTIKNAICKLESGANISITSPPAQGVENISSATPDDLGVRIKSFELNYNNNLERQVGFGGGGVAQDIDKARATAALTYTMNFLNSNAAAEYGYYTAQDVVAWELNLKGGIIDTDMAGTPLYYGVTILIPRAKIMKVPLPDGGPSDILTQTFELDIQDNGTDGAVEIFVYNAQADYLAAAA